MNRDVNERASENDLTPINIRRRRRSKLPNLQTPPVNKRLRTKESSSAAGGSKPNDSTHLSLLERLPTELLEIILEESFNVSFPQHFHRVGRRLSSPVTIRRFCDRIFCELKNNKGGVYIVGGGSFGKDVDYWRKARQQVLTCRFITASFLEDVICTIEEDERAREKTIEWPFDEWHYPRMIVLPNLILPTTFLLSQKSDIDKVKIMQTIVTRGASIDTARTISGELIHSMWTTAIKSKEIRLALDITNVMGHENVEMSLTQEHILWAVRQMSQWWDHGYFPFLCVLYRAVPDHCHTDPAVVAALKSKGWICPMYETSDDELDEIERIWDLHLVYLNEARTDSSAN